MHFQIHFLGSSSAGNCALVQTPISNFLIDAGFTGRKIENFLLSKGVSIEQLHGIFVTHEHVDHIAGLRGLSKYSHVPIFATVATAQAIEEKFQKSFSWRTFQAGERFLFRDIQVETLAISHDAVDPVAYVFTDASPIPTPEKEKLAWLTDLGHIPVEFFSYLKNADQLFLEANYDAHLLEICPTRPLQLKERIRGLTGHLSNNDVRQFLEVLENSKPLHIYMGHLSRECNQVQLVQDIMESVIRQHGWSLQVLSPL